jgi:riboflavin biosynthesis pyrimidine reductase
MNSEIKHIMKRPYIICHMGSTVDGRIISEHWGDKSEKYGDLYEQCHNSFDSQAWMVGRVTMEKNFTDGRQATLKKSNGPLERKPFIGDKNATSFAIAVDAKGKLGWDSNEIDGDHVIEILSEAVSDDYLQYLQDISVSYIFAGTNDLDFNTALEQLHEIFGIKKLMLEGGGNINGSLLNAGLIDELSLLILPLADGTSGTPTTFEITSQISKQPATELQLVNFEKLPYDVLWLRYQVIKS